MITSAWDVANLERETADGKVVVVHYVVSATDGTRHVSAYGSIGLSGEISIPYSELTSDTCIGWVKDSLGAERVAEVEAALAARLAEQAAPTKATGLPWA